MQRSQQYYRFAPSLVTKRSLNMEHALVALNSSAHTSHTALTRAGLYLHKPPVEGSVYFTGVLRL